MTAYGFAFAVGQYFCCRNMATYGHWALPLPDSIEQMHQMGQNEVFRSWILWTFCLGKCNRFSSIHLYVFLWRGVFGRQTMWVNFSDKSNFSPKIVFNRKILPGRKWEIFYSCIKVCAYEANKLLWQTKIHFPFYRALFLPTVQFVRRHHQNGKNSSVIL